ncbi:hypothetical protein C8F01DRAFT_1230572 [Mycena amicta]|nr:hypothetical protein C8F01DRAFT_1230572 [Mycena amicta]
MHMHSKLAILLSASSVLLLVKALPQCSGGCGSGSGGGDGGTAPSAAACGLVGNVSLVWGSTTDTLTTAIPVGFSTAPVDGAGHVLLATRTTIPAHAWNAIGCHVSGGGGAGGGGGNVGRAAPAAGGGGGGGGGPATTSVAFGAIADLDTNLCLTVSNMQAGLNMTISREACIQPLTNVPDVSQAWEWTTSPSSALTTLVFLGATTLVAAETPTNYVPSLVGTGIGAYVDLVFHQGAFLPSGVNKGLLVSFVTANTTDSA